MPRVTIGAVEVTPLLDSRLLMDPRMFMPAHADEFVKALGPPDDPRGLYPMAVTCFLLRSAGKTILVDTGIGRRRRPNMPLGNLNDSLAEAGVRPDEVDVVLNTHLHVDHVGWNTIDKDDGTREIFFPKAKFWFQQGEWDFWMTPAKLADPGNAHLVECVEPLKDTGRITFADKEQAIDEHLTFIPTPGHTPGHVAIGIVSQGERAVIVGDASHHAVQLLHPDWSPSFDTDPVLAGKTRAKLFDFAIDEGRTWMAGHWEHPGMGRLARLDGKRTFTAL
jgi:glyoxylase-like metal-dependent hydrolase (beta-lactamase superfamily II)